MTNHRVFSDDDIEAMREAMREAMTDAIKDAAPTIASETTRVLQTQLELAIGRGVLGWVRRVVLAAFLILAGYFASKGWK